VAITAGLGLLATAGLTAAASLEQTEVAFSSLLRSAEKGAEVFDGLKQFAASTPFELGDITGAAQRFLAFNDAVRCRRAVAALPDHAGRHCQRDRGRRRGHRPRTLAFGQIASRGKVSLEELLISEAFPGFNAVAAIAGTRHGTAQALEDISAGAVPATQGIRRYLTGWPNSPAPLASPWRQSQTLLGVFSTFKDTISQALAGAFEPVIPALKDSLTEATPLLGDALSEIAPAIGTGLVRFSRHSRRPSSLRVDPDNRHQGGRTVHRPRRQDPHPILGRWSLSSMRSRRSSPSWPSL
jgi:hypothetical protein